MSPLLAVRRGQRSLFFVALALALLGPSAARAQTNPKFEYGKEEEAKKLKELKEIEWKASASAGLVVTTGNSRTETISGSAQASRRDRDNRVQLDANGAFARSRIFVANDIDGSGTIDSEDEIQEQTQTTTNQWLLRARYDRFLTLHNSLFVSAAVGANEPAGKDLIANGQLGYAREIVKDDINTVTAEIGYDYTHEKLASSDKNDVNIHSARGFLGYTGKVSKDTEVTASAELLVNLNEVDLPSGTVDRGEDSRVNGQAGLTTKLFEDISFRFGFTVLYDNAPAPRPAFAGIPYGGGFLPLADKVDTRTEASIIINFL